MSDNPRPPITLADRGMVHPNDTDMEMGGNFCCGTDEAEFQTYIDKEMKLGESQFHKAVARFSDPQTGLINAAALNSILSSFPGMTEETLNTYDVGTTTPDMSLDTLTLAGPGNTVGLMDRSPPPKGNVVGRYSAAATLIECVAMSRPGATLTSTNNQATPGTPSAGNSSTSNAAPGYPFTAATGPAQPANLSLTISQQEVQAVFDRIKGRAQNIMESAKYVDSHHADYCCFINFDERRAARYPHTVFEMVSASGSQCMACVMTFFPNIGLFTNTCALCFACKICTCDICYALTPMLNCCCFNRSLHHASYRTLYHAWDMAVREEVMAAFRVLYKWDDGFMGARQIHFLQSLMSGSFAGRRSVAHAFQPWSWWGDAMPIYAFSHPFVRHHKLVRRSDAIYASGSAPSPASAYSSNPLNAPPSYTSPVPAALGTIPQTVTPNQYALGAGAVPPQGGVDPNLAFNPSAGGANVYGTGYAQSTPSGYGYPSYGQPNNPPPPPSYY